MYYYAAFGLTIESPFPIRILQETDVRPADVSILENCEAAPDLLPESRNFRLLPGDVRFRVPEVATFRIVDGNTIFIYDRECDQTGKIWVYLMGSCMGAILHQRGMLPLHGSSVCKDGKAILITGESGAGKSSLAAEFLKNGWKLVTDDVAVVNLRNGKAVIQPSYPSQKLWMDAIERYDHKDSPLQSLYQENRKDKFSVDVSACFENRPQELTCVVRLCVAGSCSVQAVDKMTAVHQLMRNTYRSVLILREDYQQWFEKCVGISSAVRMLACTRTTEENCAPDLFRMVTDWMVDKE